MKSLQVIAHTAGGEVLGAVEQVTERDYEALKDDLSSRISNGASFLSFNTDDGWVLVPAAQLLYLEIKLY